MADWNVVVDPVACWEAFQPKEATQFYHLNTHTPQEHAKQNITVFPEPEKESRFREITWKFKLPIVASERIISANS